MDKRAVWSTFRARPGKEAEVEAFLADCCARIGAEQGTTTFFVLKLADGRYATFDTFRDDEAFQDHLHGPTAATVKARTHELFEGELMILQASVLDAKPLEGQKP